jgi:hypothetical protein
VQKSKSGRETQDLRAKAAVGTRWIIEDRKWKLEKRKKKAGGVKPPPHVDFEIG